MILDELTILINADSKGIENTLKKTLQVVTGTVNDMNKQEVDWTSIFTRAVSPALIGGIASMFAFAIGQSLQFQQAMNTTGTAAGENSSQIAQTGQAALGMSSQMGQSANDIAQAMLQVSAIFGVNTDATKQVSEAMSQLADSGFGSLNDIISATIPLFKEFGITTADQAISMLTSLMHGAEASKESLSALAGQFGQFAPALVAAGANFTSFNGLIADFSGRIQALGLSNANAVFQALADSANKPTGPMELLGQNINKVQGAIKNGDVSGLVDNLSKKLQEMGNIAQLVATNMGLSADQVNQFKITAKNLPTVNADIKAVATNTQSIKQAWDQSNSGLRTFITDWNKLVALVTSGNIAKFMTDIAEAIGKVIDAVDLLVNGKAGEMLFDLLNGKGNLQAMAAAITPLVSNPFTTVAPSAPILSSSDAVQSALLKSGQGFNSGALNSIDSKAQSSGLVQALIAALSSGISSSNSSYNNIKNSFNLALPNTGQISAQQIAQALYKSFQGTQK